MHINLSFQWSPEVIVAMWKRIEQMIKQLGRSARKVWGGLKAELSIETVYP